MNQPNQNPNPPDQKKNKNRLLSLRKLARTPYDKKIIQTAIADGLTDDDIKIMLGHPTGPMDNQELPDNYDVDVDDGSDQGAPQQAKQSEGAVKPPPSESPDSGKAVLAHIAGLLTHLSKG